MLVTLYDYQILYGQFDDKCTGKIPREQLELWLNRAESELSRIVSGKLDEVSQLSQATQLVCEMAEAMYIAHTRQGIASENNDGYSVTYRNDEDSNLQNELYRIAKRYLSDTNLLYRGVL